MTHHLLAGSPLEALDFMPPKTAFNNTTQSVTSQSYVSGSVVVSTTFTAPTSGRVLVIVGGGGEDARMFLSPEIFEGSSASGDALESPQVQLCYGFVGVATSPHRGSRAVMLEGLDPGQEYFVRLQHRKFFVTETGSMPDRRLDIVPLP
jgi:hypothetical protein